MFPRKFSRRRLCAVPAAAEIQTLENRRLLSGVDCVDGEAPQVEIEVGIVQVNERFLERAGIDFDFDVQQSEPGDRTVVPSKLDTAPTSGGESIVGGRKLENKHTAKGNLPDIGFAPIVSSSMTGGHIGDLLDQLRRLQDLQVTIEVRIMTLADNFFDRIGVDFDVNNEGNDRSSSDGEKFPEFDLKFQRSSFDLEAPDFGGFNSQPGERFGHAILSDIETFFLLQSTKEDIPNVLQTPKLTLFGSANK